jgi:hypothetical protein
MTAKKIWEYKHDPIIRTNTMGNAQRLPNGNTLINWAIGSSPKAAEVTPLGETVYEGDFVMQTTAYRTFRYEWDGYSRRPYLVIERRDEIIRLIYNLFGADSIAEYKIYGGTNCCSEDLIATTSNKWIDLSDLENLKKYYFKVTAVDSNGFESEFSNQDSILIIRPEPGINLIPNGDFSENQNYWDFYLFINAVAEASVNEEEQLVFNISNGGTSEVGVQLRQNGIPLVEGNNYIFEFDAYAEAPRSIVAKVGMDEYPYTNYSGINTTDLTVTQTHYSHNFKMNYPTDYNSRVVFNCGSSNSNVIIDNVSLRSLLPNDINETSNESLEMLIFPNPVNKDLNIVFPTEVSDEIQFTLYATDGRQLLQNHYIPSDISGGNLTINLSDLDVGLYLCQISFYSKQEQKRIMHFESIAKISK